MRLGELLGALPRYQVLSPAADVDPREIAGISCDSRSVRPGSLFVAVPGVNVDGHGYITDALQRGAIAVVGERAAPASIADTAVPHVRVPDAREAWAWLSAAWFGHPGRRLRVIGVTGTDGKTTTVRLIAEILQGAGRRVGWIHTVSAHTGGDEADTGLHTTTPDAYEVQGYLARMVASGLEYAVIEATSHGLAQHRVTACEFDVAVVTNITHEHLDYHRTFAAYQAAKGRLFGQVGTSFAKEGVAKLCVLNADDAAYDYLERLCVTRALSYGVERPSDVEAFDVESTAAGLSFKIATPQGALAVHSPLLGRYNVYNILAAVAVTLEQGVPFPAMQKSIAGFAGVVGRGEKIDLGQDFSVIVDFAHTPNALRNALQAVREAAAGRVTVVFGCAGLRDRAKRPQMGEIAGELADTVVLTAEDPRTEDLQDILAQIAVGCERAGRREGVDYWKVADRAEAIATAIDRAQPGDVVLVTGKGHERSMCFGTVEVPWSDHEAVREALRARLSR